MCLIFFPFLYHWHLLHFRYISDAATKITGINCTYLTHIFVLKMLVCLAVKFAKRTLLKCSERKKLESGILMQ
jgi:hypothetical protein